jgi:hypothetical protein
MGRHRSQNRREGVVDATSTARKKSGSGNFILPFSVCCLRGTIPAAPSASEWVLLGLWPGERDPTTVKRATPAGVGRSRRGNFGECRFFRAESMKPKQNR